LATVLVSMSCVHSDSDSEKIKTLQSKNVTYVFYGIACPNFVDTYTIYGFRMECGGCLVSKRSHKRNNRAVKTIESVYGSGWFEKNEYKFTSDK
jgi:hypothetical protein